MLPSGSANSALSAKTTGAKPARSATGLGNAARATCSLSRCLKSAVRPSVAATSALDTGTSRASCGRSRRCTRPSTSALPRRSPALWHEPAPSPARSASKKSASTSLKTMPAQLSTRRPSARTDALACIKSGATSGTHMLVRARGSQSVVSRVARAAAHRRRVTSHMP